MPADIAESATAVVTPVCAACGSTSVRRSRRQWLDGLAMPIGYYPYRCRDCRARFHLKAPPRPRTRPESRARRRTALRRELLVYALALVSFAALVALLVRDHD